MDYGKIYNNIIKYRLNNRLECYTESHHILPRSLGGTDDGSNLVDLSAREHYICHLLLTKIYPKGSQEYYKMLKAYNMMAKVSSSDQLREYKINSRIYESLRKELSKAMSISQTGELNSQYGTMWIYNPIIKESKKVCKNSILEDGWVKGRVTDWNNYFTQKICLICGKHGLKNRLKFCSDECRNEYLIKQKNKKLKEKNHKSLDQIIEESIIKDSNGCWNWQKSTTTYGFPQQIYEGKNIQVHRYMYNKHIEEIDSKLRIIHTCDNKKCCNPEHLITKSQTEINNERDCVNKNSIQVVYGNITYKSIREASRMTGKSQRFFRNLSK